MMEAEFSITFSQRSDVGLLRTENQDSCGKFPADSNDLNSGSGLLFVVADGMGGHRGGQQASQMAVNIINKFYFENSGVEIPERLRRALEETNAKIFQFAQSNEEFTGMGTTCTCLVFKQNQAYIAHVGDSRAYRINRNEIVQLTRDHSQVAELQRQGILTEKEAKQHPQRNLLNRALGARPTVDSDTSTISIHAGDHFLLCSDGLAKVEVETLQEVILGNTPEEACEKLVELANQLGGEDNVTVQVIRLNSANSLREKISSTLSSFWKK
jgi:protein phosphatase